MHDGRKGSYYVLSFFLHFNQDRIVLDKAESISMHKISGDSGLLPSTDITGLLENDAVQKSQEEDSQMLESVPCVPDNEVLYFLCFHLI